MATATAQSVEDSIKELFTYIKERYSGVIFVFQSLQKVRRVPACIKAKLKMGRPHKGHRRNEEEVKDYWVPISRIFLMFMEYESKGKLQLPHVVVDETASDGQLRSRLIGGKVKQDDDGQLKQVAAPGQLAGAARPEQGTGAPGGLLRASKKHVHILENGIDPAMIKEFVDLLLAQCKNSGWRVAIEHPVNS